MELSEPEIVDRARADLARRLGLADEEISTQSIEQTDFPDAALGAPIEDEMSAQIITSGWRVHLKARGQTYEYRSNGKQLRLVNFDGENHRT